MRPFAPLAFVAWLPNVRGFLALLLWVASAVTPHVAFADAVGIPEGMVCPEGARMRTSHGAAFCEVRSCVDCAGGDTCQRLRVCTRALTYREGSRTWPPPEGFNPEHHVRVVMATCAPDASCTGEEEGPPRASIRIPPGPATCVEESVCAAAPPSAASPTPASSTAATSTAATSTPETSSSCAAGHRGRTPLASFLALGALLVSLTTRLTTRRARSQSG